MVRASKPKLRPHQSSCVASRSSSSDAPAMPRTRVRLAAHLHKSTQRPARRRPLNLGHLPPTWTSVRHAATSNATRPSMHSARRWLACSGPVVHVRPAALVPSLAGPSQSDARWVVKRGWPNAEVPVPCAICLCCGPRGADA
eukprot:349608-Chlamydomonas_euryale.AAC.11